MFLLLTAELPLNFSWVASKQQKLLKLSPSKLWSITARVNLHFNFFSFSPWTLNCDTPWMNSVVTELKLKPYDRWIDHRRRACSKQLPALNQTLNVHIMNTNWMCTQQTVGSGASAELGNSTLPSTHTRTYTQCACWRQLLLQVPSNWHFWSLPPPPLLLPPSLFPLPLLTLWFTFTTLKSQQSPAHFQGCTCTTTCTL